MNKELLDFFERADRLIEETREIIAETREILRESTESANQLLMQYSHVRIVTRFTTAVKLTQPRLRLVVNNQ